MTFQDFINNLRFEQVDMILCVLATVLFSVGWFYFFYYFNPIKLTPSEPITAFPPVSIIISARNSVLKLEDNIQHWLTQDYPNFEVVIIDDRSSDETAYFLVKTAEKEPLLKYVLLDPDVIKNGSKKLALTLGIKKAKNNYFLLTDADCIPSSDQWLKHMATGFTHKKDIVLGVSPVNTKKSFFKVISPVAILTKQLMDTFSLVCMLRVSLVLHTIKELLTLVPLLSYCEITKLGFN